VLGIGIDWAEEFHLVALGRPDQGVIEVVRVEHHPKAVSALAERIAGSGSHAGFWHGTGWPEVDLSHQALPCQLSSSCFSLTLICSATAAGYSCQNSPLADNFVNTISSNALPVSQSAFSKKKMITFPR
jgi:hypothetical protein